MPFNPGEKVNLRFVGDPASSRLLVAGNELTVASGGLSLQRDGGLIAILQLPATGPCEVDYVFLAGDGGSERGKLRVTDKPATISIQPAHVVEIEAPPHSGGIEAG